MNDTTTNASETAVVAQTTTLSFSYEGLGSEPVNFDCASIPAEARLDMLKGAVQRYIYNRLNQRQVQFEKTEDFKAWAAYDAATSNDPMQTLVSKPTNERPTPPDFKKLYDAATADLIAGTMRKRGEPGTGRKSAVDPLTSLVTQTVVREVYASKNAADKSFTYLKAKAEVGTDGIAYLRNLIETKVAAGADAAALNAMLETRYLKPARLMLGLDTNKAIKEGVSIL